MRTFILLAVVALASAESSGYTYGQASNGGYAAGSGIGSVGGSYGGGSVGGGSFGGGSFGGGSVGGGSFGGGSVGGGSFGGGSVGGGSFGGGSHGIGGSSLGGSSHGVGDYDSGRVGSAGPAELNKEFFTFSAPEGEFDDGHSLGDLSQSLKKNLRVIFIRAPENNGLSDAALNLAKSAGDSKTAIYVLTKQGDIGDLANKLQNLNNRNANKPEVHFVKYRTPEDAANAQHQIQSQYDRLGGSSQSHNGGVAPVLDFASKGHSHHGGVGGGSGDVSSAPANSYIPPAGPSATYLPIVKF